MLPSWRDSNSPNIQQYFVQGLKAFSDGNFTCLNEEKTTDSEMMLQSPDTLPSVMHRVTDALCMAVGGNRQ